MEMYRNFARASLLGMLFPNTCSNIHAASAVHPSLFGHISSALSPQSYDSADCWLTLCQCPNCIIHVVMMTFNDRLILEEYILCLTNYPPCILVSTLYFCQNWLHPHSSYHPGPCVVQILRVVPYSATQLYSYEVLKKRFQNDKGELTISARLAAGGLAGMVATLVGFLKDNPLPLACNTVYLTADYT